MSLPAAILPRAVLRRGRTHLAGTLLASIAVAAVSACVREHPSAAPAKLQPQAPTKLADAYFVDEAQCNECHAAQASAWQGSHHDLAMQEASGATVRGDFDDASLTNMGVRTRFFQRDGKFWIGTNGEDGRPAEFQVKYTLGVEPLQQYLIELDRGRLQAFTIAWDVERQRWFDLYPDEHIDHTDALHWTRPAQNWNFMCAECHSTDVKKNYDPVQRTYRTTWKKIDVGCQACHGPASRHLARVKQRETEVTASQVTKWGTTQRSDFAVDHSWRDPAPQVETCARCHSRRAAIWGEYRHGEPLMQTHLPALLQQDLYYVDGQILGEVYEYGSFLQSKMHRQGLRCSDCHEPHSLQLRREGNDLCTGCHSASAPEARAGVDTSGLLRKDYDSPAHHFHAPGRSGSQCVDCHAPARLYMQIDSRRDHSFRIPRPDLTVQLGIPNACNHCHDRRTAQWAANHVTTRYGSWRRQDQTFAATFHAARNRVPGAGSALTVIARDENSPAIVRASALDLLSNYPGAAALDALQAAADDPNPLVRHAASIGLSSYPSHQSVAQLELAGDPIRAVRLAAVAALGPALPGAPGTREVIREYEASQRENADQPSAYLNLGNLHASLGDAQQAKADYQAAIRLDPAFAAAYVNLADLQSRTSMNAVAVELLRSALEAVHRSEVAGRAALRHALGLALVRERRYKEAIEELQAAVQLVPNDARYVYVLGVALHDTGERAQGIAVLEQALQKIPGDRDLLAALAAYADSPRDAQKAPEDSSW